MNKSPDEKIASQEDFARENPQCDFYESEQFLVRYLHSLRLRAITTLVNRALSLLSDRDPIKLIELGCGDGYVLQYIARVMPELELTGVDSNPVRIQRVRQQLRKIDLRQESAENTSFPPASFHICVCSEVLEHVIDDLGLLREMHRLLRSDGFVVITTPNLWTLPNRLKKIRGLAPEIYVPDHRREYSQKELIDKVKNSGFDIITFRSIGFYLPRMHFFSHFPFFIKLLFLIARCLPSWGRIFIILAKKKEF